MSDVAIGRHALLSDCGAAGLVTDAGSVDWLCLPRFDDAPVMARLLDDQAGHFLITPSQRRTDNAVVTPKAWAAPAPGTTASPGSATPA